MYSETNSTSTRVVRIDCGMGRSAVKVVILFLWALTFNSAIQGQVPGIAHAQPEGVARTAQAAPEGVAQSLPVEQRDRVQMTLAEQKRTAEELNPAIYVDQRDVVMIPVAGESKKKKTTGEPTAPHAGTENGEKSPMLISSILSDLTVSKKEVSAKTAETARAQSPVAENGTRGGTPSFFSTLLKQKEGAGKASLAPSQRRAFIKHRPMAVLLKNEKEESAGEVKTVKKSTPAPTKETSLGTTKSLLKSAAPTSESPADTAIASPFSAEAMEKREVGEDEDLILGSLEKPEILPNNLSEEKVDRLSDGAPAENLSALKPLGEPDAKSGWPQSDASRYLSAIEPLGEPISEPAADLKSDVREGQNSSGIRVETPVVQIDTVGPKRLMVGQEAEYTIRVRNAGGGAANELVVKTEIPAGIEIEAIQPTVGSARVSEEPNAAGGMVCVWKLGELAPEKEENLQLTFIPRIRSNIDFVSHYDFERSSIKSGIEVQEPVLELLVEGRDTIDWGVEDKYRMKIRNTGNGEAENIRLTVATGEEDSATRLLKVLYPGEEKTMEINIKTVLDNAITVRVEADADYGFSAAASKEIKILRGKLDVFVVAPEMQFVNNTVDYQVHVSNVGEAILQDVEVAAAIPPSVEYVSCSDEGVLDGKSGRLVWKIPMIKPQEEFIYQVTGRMTRAGESRFDVTAADKTGLVSAGDALVQIESIAALEMKINKPNGPVAIGSEIEYEVVITNNGTKAAEEVDAGFFLPEGLKPISVEGGGVVMAEESKVLFSKINFLGPGQSVSYKVRAEALTGGNHKVQAVLESRPDDIQLVSEEMSYFYQKRTVAKRGGNGTARVALKPTEPVKAPQPIAPIEQPATLPATLPTTELPLPELPLALPGPNMN